MAKVLISCIGTGRIKTNSATGSEESKREYETTTYQIGDERIDTSFVSEALVKHYHIDKVILIGTVKSMWEEVYRVFANHTGVELNDSYHTEIWEHCEMSSAQSPLELPHKEQIEAAMGNDSKIILINYGLNQEELSANAAKILGIEQYLNKSDELYIDITHSFRSIPIYLMNLITYLRFVSNKKLIIKEVSYGMLEYKRENNGITPIVSMIDVLNISDWIVGAYSLKEFGKADVIVEKMLHKNEKDIANRLEEFSKAMSLGYLDGIKQQILKMDSIKNKDYDSIAKLIIPPTIHTFVRSFTSKKDYSFQYNVAKWHMNNHNYGMSILAIDEAMITYVKDVCGIDFSEKLFEESDSYIAEQESKAAKALLKGFYRENKIFSKEDFDFWKRKLEKNNEFYQKLKKAYKKLYDLRNAIAHQQNKSSMAKGTSAYIKDLQDCIENLNEVLRQ